MLARKMRGLSLQDLADLLSNKVTKQALSKYETAAMSPTVDILAELTKALAVKPDYFVRHGVIELGEVSFRKKRALLQKTEDAVVERARDYIERYLEIESILGQQQQFLNPIENNLIKNKKDAEDAANLLRAAWELGSTPLTNLVEMLELRGIKVLLVDEDEALDGFASISSTGVPLVVINVKGKSTERIRFTIIHELAHVILKFSPEVERDKKLLEVLCHCFSSCFLLPRAMLVKMIGGDNRTYIAIKELISIKEYFGISLRAILHRMHEINIISDVYYKKWCVYLTKTYGPKNEPGIYKGVEKISQFEQLVARALSEGIISISKAATLCNTSINQLRKGFISVA